MPDLPPAIDVYPVHHRPMIQADADQLGLVSLIHPSVPPEMVVDAGPVGLGRVWDTRRGRSPRDRWDECCAHQDAALLWGQALSLRTPCTRLPWGACAIASRPSAP